MLPPPWTLRSAADDTDGPRERLRLLGPRAVSDVELVAILLGTGSSGRSVLELAHRLLQGSGDLRGLGRLGTGSLMRHPGVGLCKASRLVAARELGRRMLEEPPPADAPLQGSRRIFERFRAKLGHTLNEELWAIALDARHRPIRELKLAQGGLQGCSVHAGDVFRSLLYEAAAAVIFVHNHPSGEALPSCEDVDITRRLVQAGKLLEVEVLDHVIVTGRSYFSFRDHDMMVAMHTQGRGDARRDLLR
ncbi:MAG: RadC family protein [Polyangiales bacterium]